MSTCDVIMPVYNNAGVLPETLAALAQQVIPSPWRCRLIVSDDGSIDTSPAVSSAQIFSPNWDKTVILTNSHRGAAFARNSALAVATADIVFFLGADISLRPGCLARHLAFHTAYPKPSAAALGWVKWDPRLTPSPLMEWMAHSGPQNAFDELLRKGTANASHYFYGSHVSVKRAFIGDERFHTTFARYGWEDIEFGRRLAARGLILYTLPQAVGLHIHRYPFTALARSHYGTGYNAVGYQQMYPAATAILPPRSRITRLKYLLLTQSGLPAIVSAIMPFLEQKYSTPSFFAKATGLYFWKGVLDSEKHTKELYKSPDWENNVTYPQNR